MKQIIGSPGTVSCLLLRIGQFLFASASMSTMASAIGFSTYTSFWFNGYIVFDPYNAIRLERLFYKFRLAHKTDFLVATNASICCRKVTAMLSLAAACSSAGVVALYARYMDLCKIHPDLPCTSLGVDDMSTCSLGPLNTPTIISCTSHVNFHLF
ncbi:hypothetical protein DKX38_024235 [Salix brachista]|uniref:CASP-like protein n=1 Tax=Salix brachista TaxID=2182728 RepID=A0A5N5JMR0_9ROSI|nr:hypothetical protein DKX38_024235 [Salix brachista]